MKAMIFAAGIGKRLHPISEHTPKALVEIGGKPMLQRLAEKLIPLGVSEIVVNIHHHAEKMQAFIAQLNYPGVSFILSDETSQLLDTGGGLLKAKDHLTGEGPLILHNVDVLSAIDLREMLDFHTSQGALATLAVSQRSTSRYFLWNNNHLAGWENINTNQKILCDHKPGQEPEPKAFSGIHIIQPALLNLIVEQGIFSINEVYLRLASQHPILAFEHDPAYWADIGTPQKLAHAEAMFASHPDLF
ncbi:MAG: sugar phosphate nucleotidyltransferase [Bacteroides sp.]|jgi:NDP-sugar pyrophosphorylase family protein|nr:sugar phosphate nucleotidyltransferase [Bacteroides sp.]